MEGLRALQNIELRDIPQLDRVELEPLYQGILEQFHFEVGYEGTYYLLSPQYLIVHPDHVPPEVEEGIIEHRRLLDRLRMLLTHHLMCHSCLAEVHSYYLEQNNYLLIARITDIEPVHMLATVNYYTNSPNEVIRDYSDKIYIGRDVVKLTHTDEVMFGLANHVRVTPAAIEQLRCRAREKLHQQSRGVENYLKDIEGIAQEFVELGEHTVSEMPPTFKLNGRSSRLRLQEFLTNVRHLKHLLIEITSDVDELEDHLRKHDELDFVRYLVKFRTDTFNLIEYLNARVITKLSDTINEHATN